LRGELRCWLGFVWDRQLVISYWLSLGFYFLFVLGERSTIRAMLFSLISIFRVFFSFFPFPTECYFPFDEMCIVTPYPFVLEGTTLRLLLCELWKACYYIEAPDFSMGNWEFIYLFIYVLWWARRKWRKPLRAGFNTKCIDLVLKLIWNFTNPSASKAQGKSHLNLPKIYSKRSPQRMW